MNKDVYEICKGIMANGEVETFKPFENKKGVFQVKKYARSNVDGINERLFDDCRKVKKETVEKSIKIKSLGLFIKSLNESGKLVNGYEIGIKKLVTIFMSWTDGKFTFNLKDIADLKSIGQAVAYSSLMGYVPSNKMLVTILNRDSSIVIRLVDKTNNFYQWKEGKKAETKKETEGKIEMEYSDLIDFLKIADSDFLLDLTSDLKAILKDRKIIGVIKKSA